MTRVNENIHRLHKFTINNQSYCLTNGVQNWPSRTSWTSFFHTFVFVCVINNLILRADTSV